MDNERTDALFRHRRKRGVELGPSAGLELSPSLPRGSTNGQRLAKRYHTLRQGLRVRLTSLDISADSVGALRISGHLLARSFVNNFAPRRRAVRASKWLGSPTEHKLQIDGTCFESG